MYTQLCKGRLPSLWCANYLIIAYNSTTALISLYTLTYLRQDGILTKAYYSIKNIQIFCNLCISHKSVWQKSGVITRLEAGETSKQPMPTCILHERKPSTGSKNRSSNEQADVAVLELETSLWRQRIPNSFFFLINTEHRGRLSNFFCVLKEVIKYHHDNISRFLTAHNS